MDKKQLLRAIDELKAEIEKKPEDKVSEKLDEILRAVQALQWHQPYYVYTQCPLPHYPQGTWTSPSITLQSNTTGNQNGITWTNANVPVTLT
jgi:hypothetical protein